MIILDGVYTMEHNQPRFHGVNAPDRQRLDKLLNRIIARVMRRLIKDGLLIQDQEQPWLDFQKTDIVDTLNAAPIRYRVAVGPGAGSRTLTLKNPGLQPSDTQPKPFTVDRNGFSLNVLPARDNSVSVLNVCVVTSRGPPSVWSGCRTTQPAR